jgi:hypothetical protein
MNVLFSEAILIVKGKLSLIDFFCTLQIRTGLIQKLETTYLVPVAAPSCEVMMLLRPANGPSFSPGSEGDPTGLINAVAHEDLTWEAMSFVVCEAL